MTDTESHDDTQTVDLPVRLAGRLRARGLRMTRTRQAVVESFPPGRTIQAEALWALARRRSPGLGRATVFRTLAALVAAGLAERVAAADGTPAYRLTEGPEGHQHLLSCTVCGRDVPLADVRLERLLQELAEARGFRPERHVLALYGRCPDCLASGPDGGGERGAESC